MSTNDKNSASVQGTATAAKTNGTKNVQTTNRPSIPGKENEKNDGLVKTEPAKTATNAAPAQATPAPAAETKTPAAEPKTGSHDEPKNEQLKEGQKPAIQYIKPALNLEQTVKVVQALNRKNIQRLALIARIKTLEDFQIDLAENSDQLEANIYQGCKLTIEDDRGNKFITNTPNLIAKVSQFVYDTCVDKLSEIEAEIVFPQ